MVHSFPSLGLLLLVSTAYASSITTTNATTPSPLAFPCESWNSSNVICINRYASLLPSSFSRIASHNFSSTDPFSSTTIPSDPTFSSLLSNASFLVFSESHASSILGANPTIETVFTVADVIQEAPVYVPDNNKLYVSPPILPGHDGLQYEIDLNVSPPTISNFTADPPLVGANGAGYWKGVVYYTVNGTGTDEQPPGVYAFDWKTRRSWPVANSYYGYRLNGPDDLTISRNGDIWFTDPAYGSSNSTTASLPLQISTYHLSHATGELTPVDDSIALPNGVAISPDQQTLYITDTGADPRVGTETYTPSGPRNIYAFDIINGKRIGNKRSVYRAIEGIPDGLDVAGNGYVVTATGHGVDVLDAEGSLLVRVQTGFPAVNFEWTGAERDGFWVVGWGKIAKVNWGLTGQALVQE